MHKPTAEIINLFVKAGVDVNDRSNSDDDPLILAIRENDHTDIGVVKALIKAGAKVINKNQPSPFSYIRRRKDQVAITKLLVKYLKSQTANSKAFIYDYNMATITDEEVQQAILGGANVNEQNEYGQLPLTLATKANRLKIVKILLEHGANPNIVGNFNDSNPPLFLALKYTKNLELIKLLLQHGAKRDAKGPLPHIIRAVGPPLHTL